MNTDEMTIDFMDLIRRCLKRWKLIIICMAIGGILLNGVGYLRSLKTVNAIKQQIEQTENGESESDKLLTINEYMQSLSKQEIADVKDLVTIYDSYQTQYLKNLEYYQTSIKMQIDPMCVPSFRMIYLIDNHFEVTYPTIDKNDTTQDIIGALAEKVLCANSSETVSEILGLSSNVAYTQEVITASACGKNYLAIDIIAPNRKDCETIAEIVKKDIDSNLDDIREMIGEFDIKLVSEKYYTKVDRDLMSDQCDVKETMNNLKISMRNLPYGLNENQKVYYYALLDNSETITLNEEDEEKEELITPVITIPDVQFINLKYIILGIAFGVMVPCGYIALKYLLSGKVKVPEELETAFGVTVLGNVTDQTAKYPEMFKKYYHHLSVDEQLKLIVSGIQVVAEKENLKKIFITTSAMTERTKDICETISKAVGEIGIVCSVDRSVLYDPQAVKTMADADGVVFVEQIDISRYEEIAKEKEISTQAHTKIVGFVVVE